MFIRARSRLAFGIALAVASAVVAGCRNKSASEATPAASASAAKKPVDHLAPNELAPGDSEVFGLPLPRGMFVSARLKDYALAVGRIEAEDLANYVRDRVLVERVEIGAGRTVFPSVRIKGAPQDRNYRIEVVKDGGNARLVMRDITRPPPRKAEGLSGEEMWRRAGFNKDGTPIDPKTLK